MCLCFAKRTGANNSKCKSSQGKWETVFFCSQETKSPRSVGARPKKREKKKKNRRKNVYGHSRCPFTVES